MSPGNDRSREKRIRPEARDVLVNDLEGVLGFVMVEWSSDSDCIRCLNITLTERPVAVNQAIIGDLKFIPPSRPSASSAN